MARWISPVDQHHAAAQVSTAARTSRSSPVPFSPDGGRVTAVEERALLGEGQRGARAGGGELHRGHRHRDQGPVGLHGVAVDDALVGHDVPVGGLVGEQGAFGGTTAVDLGAAPRGTRARNRQPPERRTSVTWTPGWTRRRRHARAGPGTSGLRVKVPCSALRLVVVISSSSSRVVSRSARWRGPRRGHCPTGQVGAPIRRAGRRTSPLATPKPQWLEPAGPGATYLLGADEARTTRGRPDAGRRPTGSSRAAAPTG